MCIPQGRDQPDNSARVAASGVGRELATDASAADITAALAKVLADPAAHREARRFADVIAELGGGELATDEVVALAAAARGGDKRART